jgi:hypothetical protein
MKNKNYLKFITLLTGFAITNIANAAFPVGLWTVSHYQFTTKSKINSGEMWCIAGDGTIRGVNNTWRGHWKKVGDIVLIRANEGATTYVGSYSLTVINSALMTGYNQSWSRTNSSLGFYTTAVLQFKGVSC